MHCVPVPPDEPLIDQSEAVDNFHYLTVTEGTPQNITCRANSGKPAADITWLIDNTVMTEGVTREVVKPEGVKTEDAVGKLELTPTRADDSKIVECQAQNEALISPKRFRVFLKVLCEYSKNNSFRC